MSNYLTAFGDQVKTWLRNDCIRPHRPEIESARDLGSIHVHKTTIEPEKPRICLKSVQPNFLSIFQLKIKLSTLKCYSQTVALPIR